MALPYELLIGLRYTRAKRRNHFISFISVSYTHLDVYKRQERSYFVRPEK